MPPPSRWYHLFGRIPPFKFTFLKGTAIPMAWNSAKNCFAKVFYGLLVWHNMATFPRSSRRVLPSPGFTSFENVSISGS